MSAGSMGDSKQERLSALLDGEVDGAACDDACASWKADPALRRDWHTWHLIGDVLRSDDLASSSGRDQRFLDALRLRMAQEPVVLAPAPRASSVAVASRRPPSRWMVPSAVAAGFVLVAGTFAVLRGGEPVVPSAATSMAKASPDAALLREASLRQPAAEPAPEVVVVNGKLIRDARLDRYLAAHKEFAGTSALGVPSTFLRSATVHAEPR
jgi:sigma-E factor negative regulatory protein RseA